jgi:alpha-mannosidase
MGVHTGDIRGHELLACISTNMRLKRENHAAFTTLENFAEPFSTVMRVNEGRQYPASFIDRAWRYILHSLPHDSITGTSMELANEDIMIRFKRARRISEQLSITALKTLYEGIKIDKGDILNKPVAVFNPNPWTTTGPAEMLFPFGSADEDPKQRFASEKMADYIVTDLDGNPVPSFTDIPAGGPPNGTFRVRFIAKDVPGLGYKTFIFKAVRERQPKDDPGPGPGAIENEFLKLTFNKNGTFDLLDKETGRVFPGLHYFEDQFTPGSPWSYRHPGDGPLLDSRGAAADIELVDNNATVRSVRVRPRWDIPSRRAAGETIPCGITSVISLYSGVKRVDIYTEIDNRAADHRLRAAFPTDIREDTVSVDSQFGVFERNVDKPNTDEPPGGHVPTYPQRRFVDLAGGEKSLAVLNRGLPEYEARRDGQGITLLLTLIRAIGNYSEDIRMSLPGGRFESPAYIYTTEVEGINKAYYSLYPHAGDWLEGGTHRIAAEFNARLWPEAVFMNDVDKWMRGPGGVEQYYKFNEGNMPAELSYLSIRPSSVVLSALKMAEEGDGVVLRVYNAGGKKERAAVDFFRPVAGVKAVNLREREIENGNAAIALETSSVDVAPGIAGSRISFDVAPWRIVTLKLDTDLPLLRNRWHNVEY